MNLCCFIDQVGYNNLSIILSPPRPPNPVVDLLEFKIHINHKFIQSTSGSVLIWLEQTTPPSPFSEHAGRNHLYVASLTGSIAGLSATPFNAKSFA